MRRRKEIGGSGTRFDRPRHPSLELFSTRKTPSLIKIVLQRVARTRRGTVGEGKKTVEGDGGRAAILHCMQCSFIRPKIVDLGLWRSRIAQQVWGALLQVSLSMKQITEIQHGQTELVNSVKCYCLQFGKDFPLFFSFFWSCLKAFYNLLHQRSSTHLWLIPTTGQCAQPVWPDMHPCIHYGVQFLWLKTRHHQQRMLQKQWLCCCPSVCWQITLFFAL